MFFDIFAIPVKSKGGTSYYQRKAVHRKRLTASQSNIKFCFIVRYHFLWRNLYLPVLIVLL